MNMLPPLFKIDSNGKTRIWKVTANCPKTGQYLVIHGLVDGKQQNTIMTVQQKNVGKANETSLEEQAELEAQSKWRAQQDKGYRHDNLGDNTKTTLTSAKQYLPMLAKSFKDHHKKVVYPCYYQPKLDGIRCISYLDGDDVTMLSRKGKPFNLLPHLIEPIREILQKNPGLILDGELYNHNLGFQTIASIVKQGKDVHPDVEKVEYHVYDCFRDGPKQTFYQRNAELEVTIPGGMKPIVRVITGVVETPNDVSMLLKKFEKLGYEGIMIRNHLGIYEQDRRSENLQKVKSFIDEEFKIVGGKEGKGKFEGMCIFSLITKEGKEFDAMPMGDEFLRRQYWKDLPTLIGQKATVRYFELSDEGIPRFPIMVGVRPDFDCP